MRQLFEVVNEQMPTEFLSAARIEEKKEREKKRVETVHTCVVKWCESSDIPFVY